MSGGPAIQTLRHLLLAACGLLLGLILFELGMRALGISYPSWYVVDAYRGKALRPGATGWYEVEGKSFVVINSRGLRDKEHEIPKPPGVLRIAILGDSYAEAKQVPLEDAFWSVLRRGLESCPAVGKRTVETVNFGVSGHATAQELMTLRHHVWVYEPDIVVQAIVPTNDIRDNYGPMTQSFPVFDLVEGRLVENLSFHAWPDYKLRTSLWGRAGYELVERSRVVQLVNHVKNTRQARNASPALPSTQEGFERGLTREVFLDPPPNSEWQRAWEITEALIRASRDETVAHGARYLLAIVTSGVQVARDPSARAAFQKPLGVPDLLHAERRLQAFGRRERIEVLALAPAMQDYAERNKVHLHGFKNHRLGAGHWNADGHALAGSLMADRICERLLP